MHVLSAAVTVNKIPIASAKCTGELAQKQAGTISAGLYPYLISLSVFTLVSVTTIRAIEVVEPVQRT